jgi:hypothetical protein
MNKAALTLIGIVINLTVLPANGAGEASIKLAAFPPTMRIAQEGPIEGASAAQMAGARGGTESCQVVVTGSTFRTGALELAFAASLSRSSLTTGLHGTGDSLGMTSPTYSLPADSRLVNPPAFLWTMASPGLAGARVNSPP